jgi:predicted deacylase
MLRQLRLFKKYYLTTRPERSPVRQSDFPMHIEPFDFDLFKKELYSFEGMSSIDILEKILYKNETFEIFRIEYKTQQPKKKLLIFAGVHGNEMAPVLATIELLKDIKSNPDQYKEWNIRIIAPVNPVSVQYQSRYNEDGYDTNRDFQNFNTIQARLQRDEIEMFGPDLVIDLHEHAAQGFMCYVSPQVPLHTQNKFLADIKSQGISLWKPTFLQRLLGTKIGVSRSGFITIGLSTILGFHSLMRYLRNKKIPCITTETPWNETDLKKRTISHVIAIRSIINEI